MPRLNQTLALTALAASLAACSSPAPTAYSGLASASQLVPNTQGDSDHVPYRYATAVNWHSYDKIIIDPVAIYRGPDQQFGTMSEADKATLADYMQNTFQEKLCTRFMVVTDPGPGTLRVKLTLTGASTTTPVLGTAMHLDLAGNLYNGVQTIRGGQGAFTGSVDYAVEIYDAGTNRLLAAFVAKQYPTPYNLLASFGSLKAAKTGIQKGADALVAQLS